MNPCAFDAIKIIVYSKSFRRIMIDTPYLLNAIETHGILVHVSPSQPPFHLLLLDFHAASILMPNKDLLCLVLPTVDLNCFPQLASASASESIP